MNRSKKISSLDSLRGIACIIVLITHIISTSTVYGKYVSGCGKIGVWCFMILAGFFLMLPIINNDNKFNLKKYYIKKLCRIYPVYIITLIFSILIGFININDFIGHILGLKGIMHFWYMPVILKIYLIFPIFVFLYKKIKHNKIYYVLLFIIALIFSIVFPFTKYVENSIYLFWYLPVFIMGMLLAIIYNEFKEKEKNVIFDCISIIGVIGILIFMPYFRQLLWNIEPSNYLQNKYILMSFFWILIILAILFGKYLGKILEKCKLLQWIGKLSFSIYLFHFVILWKLNCYISNMWIKGVIVISITFIIAIIVNKFIEEVIQNKIKKIERKI